MKRILLSVMGLVVLGGCMQLKSAVGYRSSDNIDKFTIRRSFVFDGDLSLIEKAIELGAADRGWRIISSSDGCVRLHLDYHGRTLELDVMYDAKGYYFQHVSSSRFAYDADTGNIHPRALTLAEYLTRSINSRISAL